MWFLRVHDPSWCERCSGEIGLKTAEKYPFTLYFNGVCLFPACLMSFAVASATGLGVLLMATLFPVMVNVGFHVGLRQQFVHRQFPLSFPQHRVTWCFLLKFQNSFR